MFLARNIGAQRGPGDDFWYMPAGPTTASGVAVHAESAMRLSTVYKCVRVRSETIGMLPLVVYRRLPKGGKEPHTTHWAYRLLHDQPNPWQTAMQWRQMMQAHLDLRGNAYSQIVYGASGLPEMLVPLHPDRMKVEVLPNRMPRYHYRDEKGNVRVFVFGEILHVAGLSADGYVGMNPIELERDAIGAAIATRDYGARYFSNSARPPTWIEMPGKFDTPETRRKWVSDFSAAYGGVNSGRSPVMENGMKLHAIAINNSDAQYIENRKFQDVDIAGIFRMPPHKIGILDRATWGNIEHQQLDFATDTILPPCVAWEQALRRDLMLEDDVFPEFKLAMLLRGDTKTRYDAYGKGIQDGWLTRNEARTLENMNPLPGLDEPLEPLNMAPAGSRRASQERGEQPAGGRQALIATAAAERVARKEAALVSRVVQASEAATVPADLAEALRGHADFVAQVMAVSTETAARYVADTLTKAEAMHAAGTLARVAVNQWIQTQAAALLRLED